MRLTHIIYSLLAISYACPLPVPIDENSSSPTNCSTTTLTLQSIREQQDPKEENVLLATILGRSPVYPRTQQKDLSDKSLYLLVSEVKIGDEKDYVYWLLFTGHPAYFGLKVTDDVAVEFEGGRDAEQASRISRKKAGQKSRKKGGRPNKMYHRLVKRGDIRLAGVLSQNSRTVHFEKVATTTKSFTFNEGTPESKTLDTIDLSRYSPETPKGSRDFCIDSILALQKIKGISIASKGKASKDERGTLLKERIETKLNKAGFKIPVGDTSAEPAQEDDAQQGPSTSGYPKPNPKHTKESTKPHPKTESKPDLKSESESESEDDAQQGPSTGGYPKPNPNHTKESTKPVSQQEASGKEKEKEKPQSQPYSSSAASGSGNGSGKGKEKEDTPPSASGSSSTPQPGGKGKEKEKEDTPPSGSGSTSTPQPGGKGKEKEKEDTPPSGSGSSSNPQPGGSQPGGKEKGKSKERVKAKVWSEEDANDFYKVLGVDPKATAAEITSAWKKKQLAAHPDKHPIDEDDPSYNEGWKELSTQINTAYDTLKDAEKREAYDTERARLASQKDRNPQNSEPTSASAGTSSRYGSGNSGSSSRYTERPSYPYRGSTGTDSHYGSGESGSSSRYTERPSYSAGTDSRYGSGNSGSSSRYTERPSYPYRGSTGTDSHYGSGESGSSSRYTERPSYSAGTDSRYGSGNSGSSSRYNERPSYPYRGTAGTDSRYGSGDSGSSSRYAERPSYTYDSAEPPRNSYPHRDLYGYYYRFDSYGESVYETAEGQRHYDQRRYDYRY